MDGASIPVEWIRWAYPLLNKYFGFDYTHIQTEINSALIKSEKFEYQLAFFTTGKIDHLPNDFKISFQTENVDEIYSLAENNFPEDSVAAGAIVFLLLEVYCKNMLNVFYGIECGCEMTEILNTDKRKFYEFLLDHHHPYDSSFLPKSQITIAYGFDPQITIDNHDNWLYNLLKKALHDDLTFGGRFEYKRTETPNRPSHAPAFHRFLAYNLYLLLMEATKSTTQLPAKFVRFVIEFCKIANVKLEGRQGEYDGMLDLIKSAKRQYNNEPIPFSLVR